MSPSNNSNMDVYRNT